METTTNKVTVLGKANLREEENDATCDCCGRNIRRLVYLSDGKTVGRRCALTILKISKSKVDGAWTVFPSPEAVTGFFGYAWMNGKIVRVQKGIDGGISTSEAA